MLFLRANTAVTVMIGPFVDANDGVSPEAGLTISQGDVLLSKNGGAFAQKSDANAAANSGANGYYTCALAAGDANVAGILRLAVSESGALPVWHDYTVLPTQVYDSLINANDQLQVHANEITANLITAAAIADGAIDAATFAANAINAAAIADGAIDAATFAANAIAAAGIADGAIDAATFATNAITATVIADNALTAAKFAANSITAAKVDPDVSAEIADAVWDEASTGHTDAGKAGQQLWTDVDAILVDTGTTLDGVLSTANTNIAAILDDTGTNGVVIVNNGITSAKIAANAIAAAGIADGAIDAATFATNAITATVIADNALTAAKFAANSISAAKLDPDVAPEIWAKAGAASTVAMDVLVERIYQILQNRMTANEDDGGIVLRNLANDANIATGSVVSASNTTTRAALSWV